MSNPPPVPTGWGQKRRTPRETAGVEHGHIYLCSHFSMNSHMTNPPRLGGETHLALVVPLHDVDPGDVLVRRRPGRPRKVERRPLADEGNYMTEMQLHAEYLEERDDVLRDAQDTTANPGVVLGRMVEHAARESAAIAFERRRAQGRGLVGAPALCSRRIDSLISVARLVCERARAVQGEVDVRSREMQVIVHDFVMTINSVAEETLPSDIAVEFTRRVSEKLDGWEKRFE